MANIIVTEEQGDTMLEAAEALLLNRSMDAQYATPGTGTAARTQAALRRAYELHRDIAVQLRGEVPA